MATYHFCVEFGQVLADRDLHDRGFHRKEEGILSGLSPIETAQEYTAAMKSWAKINNLYLSDFTVISFSRLS